MTNKTKISKSSIEALLNTGLKKAEIAKQLNLTIPQMNNVGVQLNINWRAQKRVNNEVEIIDDTVENMIAVNEENNVFESIA